MIHLSIPIRTSSWNNTRGHWRTTEKRKNTEKQAVWWALYPYADRRAHGIRLPVVVTITRLAPGLLDDDNLPSATKYMRDEIARWYGVSDAPSSPITWVYHQRKTTVRDPVRYAVEITIESVTP